MKPRQKRFALIIGALAVLGTAAALVLNAFEENLVFFFTPTQVVSGEAPKHRAFRIGGMVKEGSVQRDGVNIRFVVTDTANDVPVTYTGILPDLFREGKGVVAQGKLDDAGKAFKASEVLAKHDENYMPPEAQHALDKAAVEKASKTLK
ncbi:MAG: cytochrome c maturation protein CcmE [Rhodocyclaceae bacterium]|jgi:cytochrome c-type biogenesis protein CcmE|nr:cytochrome c maturation protein CcmE [Rhodocyclaceae bacterium]